MLEDRMHLFFILSFLFTRLTPELFWTVFHLSNCQKPETLNSQWLRESCVRFLGKWKQTNDKGLSIESRGPSGLQSLMPSHHCLSSPLRRVFTKPSEANRPAFTLLCCSCHHFKLSTFIFSSCPVFVSTRPHAVSLSVFTDKLGSLTFHLTSHGSNQSRLWQTN